MVATGPTAFTFPDGAGIRAGRSVAVLSWFYCGIGWSNSSILLGAGGLLLQGWRHWSLARRGCFGTAGREDEKGKEGKDPYRERGNFHFQSLVDNGLVQRRLPSAKVRRWSMAAASSMLWVTITTASPRFS